jgi:hypothetical protein
MLHEHQAELGIIAWPNLDPLLPGLIPLLVMREPAPLVVAPEVAARLPERYKIADVLKLVPRVILLRWWQADPDGSVALSQRSETCVELPTGPARRLAIKGAGFGAFVRSAIIDDLEAGRLVIIEPEDFEPLHRDTALVTLSTDVLDRPAMRDFALEIAAECARVGTIVENRLAPPRKNLRSPCRFRSPALVVLARTHRPSQQEDQMTAVAHTTSQSFFEAAFERISGFAREYHVRRAQRIALVTLMDMDASRLDDLGLNVQDVVEALNAQPAETKVLETRREARAATWPNATVTA